MSTECYYSKMGVNSYRMKSPAVTKGGRTLATKKITTKIGGYFTERLVTTQKALRNKFKVIFFVICLNRAHKRCSKCLFKTKR